MPGRGRSIKIGSLTIALFACGAVIAHSEPAKKSSRRAAARTVAAVDVPGRVNEVRFWSKAGATRVAIELNGPFEYRADRLSNPERLFFDLPNTKPGRNPKGVEVIAVGDALLKQIRVAETVRGTTRVVLDLNASIEHTASQLSNPDRLLIEIRPTSTPGSPLSPRPEIARAPETIPPVPAAVETALPPVRLESRPPARTAAEPPAPATTTRTAPEAPAPATVESGKSRSSMKGAGEAPGAPKGTIRTAPETPAPATVDTANSSKSRSSMTGAGEGAGAPKGTTRTPLEAPSPATVETVNTKSKTSMAAAGAAVESAGAIKATRTPEPGPPVAAKRDSNGQQSLTRVLGLKLGKVVIDPGHGGHDAGTQGPTGLLEKDLVLDVAKRLGALIEERMGSEVVYTRHDDTFIPLEQRTQLANRHKADLFLSIHANSSPVKTASGVETYYLNFTTDKAALEVAARENASSERSIFDLGDLVRQIARKDKVDESREFASRIQSSLIAVPARGNKARNRGVKKAPFVVLIGAAMPSVLAEIGFVSNPQDEALMKKPDHRQKIAEALFKGLSQYASTLSRFEMAGGGRRSSGDE